jgi:hypothetical protein
MSYIDLLSWIKIVFMKHFSFLIMNLFEVKIILLISRVCLKIRFILKIILVMQDGGFLWLTLISSPISKLYRSVNILINLKKKMK